VADVRNLTGSAWRGAPASQQAHDYEVAFLLRMSAFGPKQTSASALHMSAFGGKADMTYCDANVRF